MLLCPFFRGNRGPIPTVRKRVKVVKLASLSPNKTNDRVRARVLECLSRERIPRGDHHHLALTSFFGTVERVTRLLSQTFCYYEHSITTPAIGEDGTTGKERLAKTYTAGAKRGRPAPREHRAGRFGETGVPGHLILIRQWKYSFYKNLLLG